MTFALFAVDFVVQASDDVPKIRELPSNQNSLDNKIFKNDTNDIYPTKDITQKSQKINAKIQDETKTTPLKGEISELKAIVGKSQLINFDEPLKRISIANKDIADLVLISPKEMLINGKKGGETSLILWGEKGDPKMFTLFVENDSINFLKEIKKITPNDNIKVKFINSTDQNSLKVLITGHLASTKTREKIKNLVTAYGYTLVDMTEAFTPQVMLSLKVVEIDKTKIKNKTFNYITGTNTNAIMQNLGINSLNLQVPTGTVGTFTQFPIVIRRLLILLNSLA